MSDHLKIAITVPVYNEAQVLAANTADLLAHLDRSGLDYTVILAENGSRDGTAELADALAGQHPRLRALHLAEANYGRAMRQGFLASDGDVLANFSIDLVDLDFLRRALARLETADVVVGSKYAAGGADHRPLARRLGGQALGLLVKALFWLPVADTHGLLVLRRDAARPLIERCRFGNEIFDTELLVRCHRAGLRLAELPLEVHEVRPSRLGSAKRAWRMIKQFVRLRVALWREGIR